MNTIITAAEASLSNGFQSGEYVLFLTQDSSGFWVQEEKISTGEATWHDDEIVEDMKVSLVGKKGIHISFRGDSSSSRIKSVHGFFGFTAEDLESSSPESGYECHDVAFNAYDWKECMNLGDYLVSKFVHIFTPWGEDGVKSPPYSWGDQAADSFALVVGGKVIDSVKGQGDTTPYLTESDAKCLADRKLYTSCQMQDEHEERADWDARFIRAAERIGIWEEYLSVINGGYTPTRNERADALSRKIEAEMVRLEADERAEEDPTGILKRLLRHYRGNMNPLKTLRKELGGVWTFHRECPEETTGSVYHGDNWYVTHVPK